MLARFFATSYQEISIENPSRRDRESEINPSKSKESHLFFGDPKFNFLKFYDAEESEIHRYPTVKPRSMKFRRRILQVKASGAIMKYSKFNLKIHESSILIVHPEIEKVRVKYVSRALLKVAELLWRSRIIIRFRRSYTPRGLQNIYIFMYKRRTDDGLFCM